MIEALKKGTKISALMPSVYGGPVTIYGEVIEVNIYGRFPSASVMLNGQAVTFVAVHTNEQLLKNQYNLNLLSTL